MSLTKQEQKADKPLGIRKRKAHFRTCTVQCSYHRPHFVMDRCPSLGGTGLKRLGFVVFKIEPVPERCSWFLCRQQRACVSRRNQRLPNTNKIEGTMTCRAKNARRAGSSTHSQKKMEESARRKKGTNTICKKLAGRRAVSATFGNWGAILARALSKPPLSRRWAFADYDLIVYLNGDVQRPNSLHSASMF